ncbi:hypothetical protein [Marinomonas rhizomae]|uniref:hypothetical protein n=1 Tax=Marinomonas rhizomae TaxID=491948 RepID=UPI0013145BF2|nr:hypothetical protein [Marinomonas rhizomae]
MKASLSAADHCRTSLIRPTTGITVSGIHLQTISYDEVSSTRRSCATLWRFRVIV